MHQKSLNLDNFWQSYSENKKMDVFLGRRVVRGSAANRLRHADYMTNMAYLTNNAPCNWVNLVQVMFSSVQFVRCGSTLNRLNRATKK